MLSLDKNKGIRQFHIADLDGGTFLKKEVEEKEGAFPTALTPNWSIATHDLAYFETEEYHNLSADDKMKFKLSTDVWATGWVLMGVLLGSEAHVKTSGIDDKEAAKFGISPSVQEFINRMVNVDWRMRPTAKEVERFMNQTSIRKEDGYIYNKRAARTSA